MIFLAATSSGVDFYACGRERVNMNFILFQLPSWRPIIWKPSTRPVKTARQTNLAVVWKIFGKEELGPSLPRSYPSRKGSLLLTGPSQPPLLTRPPLLCSGFTPTTPWQTPWPVEFRPRPVGAGFQPVGAVPEMVFNQPKRDNFLTLNFWRRKHFLNFNSIQKSNSL